MIDALEARVLGVEMGETLERGAALDREADFLAVMHRYEAPISRYLRRMVNDAELARDLAQETFLSAFRAWPPSDPERVAAWLYRIATNHALRALRRRSLLAWLPFSRLGRDEAEQASHASHDDQVTMSISIASVLARLEPQAKACLLLSAAGFTADEMGDQLGCSAGAARVRLHRARDVFRRLYHAEGPEA